MNKTWKILVTDDEITARQFVRSVLESELPVKVISASNGEECLRLAAEENPDLIILDVMMPIMDGCDAFLGLRDNPKTAKIPVVMLSSLSEVLNHMQSKARQEQPNDFVEKPVEPVILVRVVRSLLGIPKTPH